MCGNDAIKTFQREIVHNFLNPLAAAPANQRLDPDIDAVPRLGSIIDQLGRFLAGLFVTQPQATKGEKCGKTGLQMI
jgi:hypothetical protein